MTREPTVSVVMSVYNGEPDLDESLDSVLAQTGIELEFVVVNDGSVDATKSILDARAAVDSRLHVIHQANTGLTRALITACDRAKGAFIARHDCGDISLPGRLQAQAIHLHENAGDVLVGCDYELVGPGDELLRIHRGKDDGVADLVDRAGAKVPVPHHGSVMFRAAAYRQAGGYRTQFYFAQDVDLWSRMLEVGDIGYVEQILYRVKFEPGSITARHRPAQQRLRELIIQAAAMRRRGASEADILAEASNIRPQRGAAATAAVQRRVAADAAYFVASCLYDRSDLRARGYLWRTIQLRPTHWRAWSKLLVSLARAQRGHS